MADRTYRRVTEDIWEVEYITGLINADVAANAGALTDSGTDDDMTKLHRLLGYRAKWRGMLEDLKKPADITIHDKPQRTSGATARLTRKSQPGGEQKTQTE